jgi:hypothetical protein
MASSFVLRLPKPIPVSSQRVGWTYDKESQKSGHTTDKLVVLPGPGAIKLAVRKGRDADTRLFGVPTAPQYSDIAENGKLAGHAVAYYTVEERFRERQLHAALEEERPGDESAYIVRLAPRQRGFSRHGADDDDARLRQLRVGVPAPSPAARAAPLAPALLRRP